MAADQPRALQDVKGHASFGADLQTQALEADITAWPRCARACTLHESSGIDFNLKTQPHRPVRACSLTSRVLCRM